MPKDNNFFDGLLVEINKALKSNIPLVNEYLREFSESNPKILHEVTYFKLKEEKEKEKDEDSKKVEDKIDKQIEDLKKTKKTLGEKGVEKKLRVISDDNLKEIKTRLDENNGE